MENTNEYTQAWNQLTVAATYFTTSQTIQSADMLKEAARRFVNAENKGAR